jgi:thiol-disulfide isomerase/thioredoxin
LAQDRDSPIFFVAPIKTEVHRAVISEEASAYAVVNCSALAREGKFNPAPLDEQQFIKALKQSAAAAPSHLVLVLRYEPPGEVDESVKKSIRSRLEEICRSAGYEQVHASEMFITAAWKDVYASVQNFAEKANSSERIFEDELIKAYPLRTRLSKLVVGEADFAIEIRQPFDGRQNDIGEPLRASIKRAVRSAELGEKKGKLQYRLSSTSAGEPLIQELFSNQQPAKIPADLTNPTIKKLLVDQAARYKPSPGLKLAIELGFDSIIYSHSPGGGAPEKLVGKRAPDFELESLAAGKLALRSFVGDRPALVTFWGVACGPCCREAPHLTRMHEKYGKDFAILAVNGYDESREVVAKFAEQTKLKHPIVLGGSSVADVYQVGAYPTTFWINRQGIVEDYEVDFDSAARLESRIQAMLKGSSQHE